MFSIQSKKENVVICDTCDLSLTKGAEISRLYNIVIAWQIFITLFNSTQQCHKLKKVMTGLQNEPSWSVHTKSPSKYGFYVIKIDKQLNQLV